jgi:hypothetical protein
VISVLISLQRHNGLRIYQLSDDYESVHSSIYEWSETIESPALLKHKGIYFMFGSRLTGWKPNDNVYSTASSLSGPWSEWKLFAKPGSLTYKSQTTFILEIGKIHMYMGDRWESDQLERSTYVWLPLDLEAKQASLKYRSKWSFDHSGVDDGDRNGAIYEAEEAVLLGNTEVVSCGRCQSRKAVSGLQSRTSNGLRFSTIKSREKMRTTIAISYINDDKKETCAFIVVNNDEAQKIAFLPSGDTDGESSVAAVHVVLASGANSIDITAVDGETGPDIDKLQILSS